MSAPSRMWRVVTKAGTQDISADSMDLDRQSGALLFMARSPDPRLAPQIVQAFAAGFWQFVGELVVRPTPAALVAPPGAKTTEAPKDAVPATTEPPEPKGRG